MLDSVAPQQRLTVKLVEFGGQCIQGWETMGHVTSDSGRKAAILGHALHAVESSPRTCLDRHSAEVTASCCLPANGSRGNSP